MYSPFFPHLDEAWKVKDNPNILFLFYENMKKNLKSVIGEVSQFLDTHLSEEQVNQLLDHLDIKNFRNNPAVNMEFFKEIGHFHREGNFIRKGKVGGWREEFAGSEEAEKDVNDWVEEQLNNYDVEFPCFD